MIDLTLTEFFVDVGLSAFNWFMLIWFIRAFYKSYKECQETGWTPPKIEEDQMKTGEEG